MMSYFDRYMAGEFETVWHEICQLGQEAFEKGVFADASAVLRETMKRVRYNVDVIHQRLLSMGYKFYGDPLTFPNETFKKHLILVEEQAKHFGYVPLSTKEFYHTVGSVNFMWDYNGHPDQMWFDYEDPL